MARLGDSIAQWLAHLLLSPAAPGSSHSIPKKLSEEKMVEGAAVHQRRCLEESGQWLENVNRTHLVLASSKLLLKKLLWLRFFLSLHSVNS